MNIQRRNVITGACSLLAGTSAFSFLGLASAKAADDTVDVQTLMQPGPLGDMIEGSSDAAVTIIEYASMTCSHCAAFHNEVYPTLKEKFIDTGKARLIMREFPLDRRALAASMVARCADKDKYFSLIEEMFKNQEVWARSDDPAAELSKIAQSGGITKKELDACFEDDDLKQGILEVSRQARFKFKVSGTPTFFINGERLKGALPIDEFEDLILSHLNN